MRLLFLIILLIPLTINAQDITGVWTGYVITTDKQLPYEVIISENNGKLSGYSHITFYARGTEMVAVKKLIITNENGKWILEDDNIIYDNFKDAQPRKMKQSSVLTLSASDTMLILAGNFTTNKTRDLKPATGDIILHKSPSRTTKLFVKLDDMKLAADLSFIKPTRDIAITTVNTNNPVVITTSLPAEKPVAINQDVRPVIA
ncbi:MAG TPA: hypothetical protein VK498_05400, partial [Ferruginibacter sp.]|nr:hypothetical protein [Ferruginibacter sp.]